MISTDVERSARRAHATAPATAAPAGKLPGGRTARAVAVALAAAALLAAGGCSFTRPAPVKETFLLAPAVPARAAAPRAESLRVGIFTVGGAFRDRQFVVREGDLRFSTDFYHEFITPPAPMIAEATSRALRDAGVFARVSAPGTPADADWVLDAFVGELYADQRNAGDIGARLSITFYLSRDRAGSVPFWTHTYERRIPVRDTSAAAYVEALNKALGEVLAELARDLAAVKPPA